MITARSTQPSTLDQHEGLHLFSAAEALLKGVLEADTAVAMVAGPARESFQPVFDLAADVTALLDRHSTALLATPSAGRAVMLAAQCAVSGHRAVALVPNDELDLAGPALEQACQQPLDRGGAMCVVIEDDPFVCAAADPRQAAVRLGLPCLAPDGIAQLRLSVEHAMRLSRSARKPAVIVAHRWVLLSADTIEARPNRVLDPVVAAVIRPRRPARWAESGEVLRVARRLELNRFRSVPVRGEQLPLSFIVAGPAAAAINHVLHRLGLSGRVPVLELGLVNPVDESVVERVLRYSRHVVVLESRPGSIEADVLRIAESLRRAAPDARLANVSSQPITDEPNPLLRADEALHPSILARRIVPLLSASHPKLRPPFVPDPPPLAGPLPPRGDQLGSVGALHRVRRALADVDQWLRERDADETEGTDNGQAPTILAVDGAEPEGATGRRVLTVETWTDRRFLVDGIASLRQAAWDDRPWMFVICALGEEEVADLVRLARGAIPGRRSPGARIESVDLNDRPRLRDLLQTLATETRLSVVVAHDGPPPRYDIEAIEHDYADIDRLGYEPRQLVVQSALGNCALRRSIDAAEQPGPGDDATPLRSQVTVLPMRAVTDSGVRLRVRPLYEAVEVVRDRPPAATGHRAGGSRLELPRPVHANSSQWRAHVAGFRGAGPGTAAAALCVGGRHMGYQVRCLHDATPIGRGRRAWAQVLFTRPQADKGPLPITARIPFGEADLLLGLDRIETMRAVDAAGALRVANLDRTYAVANLGVFGHEDTAAAPDDAESVLRAVCRDDVGLADDLAKAARAVFHTDRVTDFVLLGAAYQLGLVPLSNEAVEAGVQAVEAGGFGRALEAFQFGRRLAARGPARPRESTGGGEIERLVHRTVRLLRCGRLSRRLDVDAFAKLAWSTLERTPGLTETDAGRQARRDMVIALQRCALWGGMEYAARFADLIIRLYRADRGDTGRALTRNAVLPLADAMLIRDPIYVATMVMSPDHRLLARRRLNVKMARGDRLTRRFLTRIEIGAMKRRVRLDVRTSDWTAWLAARLRHRIPPAWRGTAHEREIRDLVTSVVERAAAAPREAYERWAEALHRLHRSAADDRLAGMALSEMRMLVEEGN